MKKCKVCREWFDPDPIEAKVCSEFCAMTYAVSARGKAEKVKAIKERKETRAKLEKLKSRSTWAKEAQAAVNKYVRLRDMAAGLGCVTCGARPAQKVGGTMDAGHFRSVGSAPHLRFFLPNISIQCVTCNRHQGGRALDFRRSLVERHGHQWVDSLESMQGLAKFDIPYLQRLKRVFSKKAKRMEARNEA